MRRPGRFREQNRDGLGLKKENRNLELSSRNLEGVELVRGREVHPYHLLRYDRDIFSRPALEKLQDSLKASAPKRKAEVA